MKRAILQKGAGLCILILLLTCYAYGQQGQMPSNTCGAQVPAATFKAQRGVGAGVKDFPFELKYEVVSYTFTINTDEDDIIVEDVVGNLFAGKVRRAIDLYVKPGKTVTIENIRVKGPDGRISTVPALLYYII
jgi:hypothetical protein